MNIKCIIELFNLADLILCNEWKDNFLQISSYLLDYVMTGKVQIMDPIPDGFFGDDIEGPPVEETF